MKDIVNMLVGSVCIGVALLMGVPWWMLLGAFVIASTALAVKDKGVILIVALAAALVGWVHQQPIFIVGAMVGLIPLGVQAFIAMRQKKPAERALVCTWCHCQTPRNQAVGDDKDYFRGFPTWKCRCGNRNILDEDVKPCPVGKTPVWEARRSQSRAQTL